MNRNELGEMALRFMDDLEQNDLEVFDCIIVASVYVPDDDGGVAAIGTRLRCSSSRFDIKSGLLYRGLKITDQEA